MPRLPGNFLVSQKSAQVLGPALSLSPSQAITVDHTKMPMPQSVTAAGRKSALLPILLQSSFSNRPSSQPRATSGDSTSTASQVTFLLSTITLILACSPLYSTATTLAPVFSYGS